MLICLQLEGQEHGLMVSHTDIRTNYVVNNPLPIIITPVDEFVGSVRHEDTITPGGTASVQEHPRLIALLTVRVGGWKCDVLLPDVIIKGYGLSVELQEPSAIVLPENGLVHMLKQLFFNLQQHLIVV